MEQRGRRKHPGTGTLPGLSGLQEDTCSNLPSQPWWSELFFSDIYHSIIGLVNIPIAIKQELNTDPSGPDIHCTVSKHSKKNPHLYYATLVLIAGFGVLCNENENVSFIFSSVIPYLSKWLTIIIFQICTFQK